MVGFGSLILVLTIWWFAELKLEIWQHHTDVKTDWMSGTRKKLTIDYKLFNATGLKSGSTTKSDCSLETVIKEDNEFEFGLGVFSPTKGNKMSDSNDMISQIEDREQNSVVKGSGDSDDLQVELDRIRKEKSELQKEIHRKELLICLEREKAELSELKVRHSELSEKSKGSVLKKEKTKDSGKLKVNSKVDGGRKEKKKEKSGTNHLDKITIKDLRKNAKLRGTVKKQLKSLNLFAESSSEDSEDLYDDDNISACTTSDESTDSDDSSSDSDSKHARKKSRRKQRSKNKSGLSVSSKQKTKYPQECPQSKLQLEYANKAIKFDDLKFNQFVAGELEIISSCKNVLEKEGRLQLLKKMSYYYELYDWKALLQFYAAWIRRIESGQNVWGDDPSDIETPLLASSVRAKTKNTKGGNFKQPVVWFCSDFQKKRCSFSGSHTKNIKGVNRQVQHICASCLLKDNKQLTHPESDPACPNYEL